ADSSTKIMVQIGIHNSRANIDEDLPLRKWLYSWLLDPNIDNNYQKDVDRWISSLIVLNLFVLLFEHVPAIFEPNKHLFHLFDMFSVIVFTLEYFMRLCLAAEDEEFKNSKYPYLKYITSPFAIIDLLSVMPFYLQAFISIDLRVLRFLRLLRIFKLFRVLIPAYKEFKLANQGRTFRQKIHALVFPSIYGGSLQGIFDTFIVVWVIVSVIAVVLESVFAIHYILNIQFIILDTVAVAVFTMEYCMRIYSCVEEPGFEKAILGRFKQAKTTSSIIDFLAVLPFFLEVFLHHLFDLRFFRVFRLLRLLKLTRYTGATSTLTTVIAREWPVLAASAFIMLLMVVLTASLGYLFEHDAQPEKFENIPQSIYWAVITLASVGYGDISPITPMGRIMTIILALLGIGIFAIPAALLSSAFTDQLRIERETLKNELYDMLADGIISPEEADIINREAKRLHLSEEEVQRLIEKAKYDRELKDDIAGLPLHKIAASPTHAVEHFKTLMSQIRQLGIMTDKAEFEAAALDNARLSPKELGLWQFINKT
ncbi:MAG: ion transporter, partial [Methylococcales bacterium]